MSPTQSSHNHHHQAQYQHAKKEILMNGSTSPSSLKIHKDSHFISKSSSSSPPSSSSSSATSLIAAATTIPKPKHQQQQLVQQQQSHPVIIYTHSPKVVHTHPGDFKALVQKLTGQSYDDGMQSANNKGNGIIVEGDQKNKSIRGGGGKGNFGGTDENEYSSVVVKTDEDCGSCLGDGQVNLGFLQPHLDAPKHNYYTNMPLFGKNNNMEYVCPNPPLFNYNNESLYLNPPDIRRYISLSAMEAMNDLRGH